MSKKLSLSRRSNKRPASGRKPTSKLALGDIEAISDELKAYHRLFHAVRAVEHFISQGPWETQALLQRYQEVVAEWLGDSHGVVILAHALTLVDMLDQPARTWAAL